MSMIDLCFSIKVILHCFILTVPIQTVAATVLSTFPHKHPLKYAALGDSYASGDGAGSSRLLPNFDPFCGRFSDAYPVQITNTEELNVAKFHNLACGGATTISVLRTQVPFIFDSDVTTVQVGGNEVDFFILLNECVQQWRPFSTCETELAKARALVQSVTFLNNFNALIVGAMQAIKKGGDLIVIGYARFFNDKTDFCDKVSFSVTNPDNFLTKSMRKMFNDIVVLLNDVIRATAEAHDATYVDIDAIFEGHRFCEEGVAEPAPGKSWFFVDVPDRRRATVSLPRLDAQQQALHDTTSGFTNLTRTFHPTSQGHSAIARNIVDMLMSST